MGCVCVGGDTVPRAKRVIVCSTSWPVTSLPKVKTTSVLWRWGLSCTNCTGDEPVITGARGQLLIINLDVHLRNITTR